MLYPYSGGGSENSLHISFLIFPARGSALRKLRDTNSADRTPNYWQVRANRRSIQCGAQ